MALDGVVLRAVVHELQSYAGARISKIYQPFERDIVLHLRGKDGARRLLISANPTYPRLHFTEHRYDNPPEPPMFCMLLRKHCENGVIQAIEQVGMERIVHIDILGRDELGDMNMKRLVIEIMGRHSNMMLIEPDTGRVLDCIHHVTSAVNRHRTVVPGATYVPPPAQGKSDPLAANADEWEAVFQQGNGSDLKTVAQHIVKRFAGIGPVTAMEMAYRGPQQIQNIVQQLQQHRYEPMVVTTGEKSVFAVLRLTHLEGITETYSSVHACLDHYYGIKAEKDRIKQRVGNLYKWLQNEKNKNLKKLEKLEQTLREAQDADKYRIMGELLTASLHNVEKGMTEIEVVNYYDENQGKMVIPLDPKRSPSENAQHFFKQYTKRKNSIQVVKEQMEQTLQEISYLESLEQQLENADLNDVEEIHEELVEQGYLQKRSQRGKGRKNNEKPSLVCFYSSENIPIYVGKNNKQNEYLTNRFARPDETWLHTKDIPGSHVVIKSRKFGEETLKEAAMLAAYFSKARTSSNVPVDYTLIRHVRKPKGAKPGFVIYDHQKTLYVTPDEQRINSMRSERT